MDTQRYRGVHRLNRDEQGRVKCVACYMCATACPAHCIHIVGEQAPWTDREKYPIKFDIDELRCIYCGMCEEACPVDAIELTYEYDIVGLTRVGNDLRQGKAADDVRQDGRPKTHVSAAAGGFQSHHPRLTAAHVWPMGRSIDLTHSYVFSYMNITEKSIALGSRDAGVRGGSWGGRMPGACGGVECGAAVGDSAGGGGGLLCLYVTSEWVSAMPDTALPASWRWKATRLRQIACRNGWSGEISG